MTLIRRYGVRAVLCFLAGQAAIFAIAAEAAHRPCQPVVNVGTAAQVAVGILLGACIFLYTLASDQRHEAWEMRRS